MTNTRNGATLFGHAELKPAVASGRDFLDGDSYIHNRSPETVVYSGPLGAWITFDDTKKVAKFHLVTYKFVGNETGGKLVRENVTGAKFSQDELREEYQRAAAIGGFKPKRRRTRKSATPATPAPPAEDLNKKVKALEKEVGQLNAQGNALRSLIWDWWEETSKAKGLTNLQRTEMERGLAELGIVAPTKKIHVVLEVPASEDDIDIPLGLATNNYKVVSITPF